jgi:HEAT repeat protein
MNFSGKKAVHVLLIAAVSAFLLSGCGKKQEEDIIPESDLSSGEKEEIRTLLKDTNYMMETSRSVFAQKYGSEGMPFMIERVMEIYAMGPDTAHPKEYSIASNLIMSLGDIGDKKALPALKLWLEDKKYRVFRRDSAHALGNLGNKDAAGLLKKIWDEEKSYLEQGDDEGPWPFAGYHPSGGYVHGIMGEIGKALFKLGEKSIIKELIEIAKISENRWTAGTMKIFGALRDITGETGLMATSSVQYWEKWWEENKGSYK